MMTAYGPMADNISNPLSFSRVIQGERSLDPNYRVLELTGLLQTTLDVGELVKLFLKELQTQVDFDGCQYAHKDQAVELIDGSLLGHNLGYSLSIQGERLGEIAFYRSYEFSDKEARTLEDLLAALLYPLRNALQYRSAVLSALNAIYAFVAGAFGFLAKANTPEDGASVYEQVANTHEPLPEEESEDDSEPVG